MTDFTIARSIAKTGMRFVDTAIETQVVDDIARATVKIERGVANPLGKIPGMGYLPLGQGSFFNRAQTLVRQPTPGGGVGSFDDAVKALHNLGSHHGVDGIKLSDNPAHAGLLKFKGELGFGSTLPPRIDDTARIRIDRAARLVQEFVDARA
jgi:hypothetical protein